MFNLGVGCRRISEDERWALKGSGDYEQLKELHARVGVDEEFPCKEGVVIDEQIECCDEALLREVLTFCKAHKKCLQEINVNRNGKWIQVVFFAARVGGLKALEDYIRKADKDHFGDACVRALYDEIDRNYAHYLKHYVQKPEGAVTHDEFSKAVDDVLRIYGFTDISEVIRNAAGTRFDYGVVLDLKIFVRDRLKNHPVVQGYLLRKDFDVPAGDEPMITELERQVLSLLPSRLFGFRDVAISNILSRATEDGRASEILGNGLNFNASEVVIVSLQKKVERLKVSNPDVYNNVHVLKDADMKADAFGRKLQEIAKGEVGVELAQGVNYVLLKGHSRRTRWGDDGHGHLYVGVIVKEGDHAKVVSVIGVNSWTNYQFQKEEQEAFSSAFEGGKGVKIIWTNNKVQDHRGDGSCAYYALKHTDAFIGMIAGCKKDLDAYFLAGRLGREYTLGELIKQNMRAQMPSFYERAQGDRLLHHSRKTDEKIELLTLFFAFFFLPITLGCAIGLYRSAYVMIYTVLCEKIESLSCQDWGKYFDDYRLIHTFITAGIALLFINLLHKLLQISYNGLERRMFQAAGGLKEALYTLKPWEIEGRPNEGRRAETMRLRWKVDRTILKFLLGKKDFTA